MLYLELGSIFGTPFCETKVSVSVSPKKRKIGKFGRRAKEEAALSGLKKKKTGLQTRRSRSTGWSSRTAAAAARKEHLCVVRGQKE